jgi:hypothetical protein
MNKLQELASEFRSMVGGARLVDSLAPPLLFALLNALFGLFIAGIGAVAVAVLLALYRLARGQRLLYALLGLAGVAIAAISAWGAGGPQGFFLPELLGGGLLTLGCLVSVLVRRPLVALTSHIARGWPLDWYWHPSVRPAYTEVTFAWALFFGLRLALQTLAFLRGQDAVGVWIGVLGGWPATVLLLAVSYLYGLWRLNRLGGPSVHEFRHRQPPPWEGQRQGF